MKTIAVFAALLFSLVPLTACADDVAVVAHNFKAENLGIVLFSAPEDWPVRDKYDAEKGTTAYEFETPVGANFKFFMVMGSRAQMKMGDLNDSGLEDFVTAKAAPFLPKTLEGRAIPQRFGFKKDGVYARLTDKTEKPKPQYLYMVQGVRLPEGDVGVYFAFFSNQKNDQDERQLKLALATVDSIKITPPEPVPVEEAPE